jgi:hypothetical protein
MFICNTNADEHTEVFKRLTIKKLFKKFNDNDDGKLIYPILMS